MILGKLASMGINVAKRAAKPALNKLRQADGFAVRKVNNAIMPNPNLTREMSVRAKAAAVDAASNANRHIAKTIVRSSYAAVPAAGLQFTKYGKYEKGTPASKPKAGPKTKANSPLSASGAANKLINTANKLYPKNKAVKKASRPTASIPTTRNRRNMGLGPKTKVEVGSSVIRDRKGAIKKVTGPSDATRAIVDSRKNNKSKYARMSRFDISKLGGMEKRNYKKWKASQGK